jgi:hypothetical protein
MLRKISILFLSVIYFIISLETKAQVSEWWDMRRGSMYISCGYDINSSPASTIHIYQAELNNSYDLLNVKSDKSSSSGSTSILNAMTYNIGYFFNYNQTWAIEVCYDPFNYYIADNQNIHLKGIKNGNNIDTNFNYSMNSGNHYYFSKGSCLLQVNLVRRYPIYRNHIRNLSLDLYGKIGIGPTFINEDNMVDGYSNNPKFSTSGGWNADCAGGVRVTIKRHIFAELLAKYVMVNLDDVNIYEGIASQKFTTTSVNLNAGLIFSTTRRNPLFRKGEKKLKKGIPTGPEPRGDLNPAQPDKQIIDGY